jgi:hypothetical protein
MSDATISLHKHNEAMAKALADLQRVGMEHDLFQRALWLSLGEAGNWLTVGEGEGGGIEYIKQDNGRVMVRRKTWQPDPK